MLAWPLLALAAIAFHAARAAKFGIFRLGLFPRTRLAARTVSVGNLAIGGTGKTPITRAICRWLSEELRLETAVLCRGYGSRNREWVRFISRGGKLQVDAGAGGDEAWLLAASLPRASVLVGKRRVLTGRAAQAAGAAAVVLDDGFQYWRLERDLDVVCFSAIWPPEAYRPFPLGLLREPWKRLRDAHAAVITGGEWAPASHRRWLGKQIHEAAPGLPVFDAEFKLKSLSLLGNREPAGGGEIVVGKKVLAVSNIASPGRFRRALEAAGAEVSQLAFGDHHRHSPPDVTRMFDEAVRARAHAIVATEKDEQSLMELAPPPASLPFYIARGEIELPPGLVEILRRVVHDGVTR